MELKGLRFSLVYPPYGPTKNEPGIRTVKKNYGLFQNLSLLYVASILEREGCRVQFIDSHAEGLSLVETIDRLKRFDPDYIGYTLTTYLFFQTYDWIKAIKEAIPVPVIVGGVHMGLYPVETLSYREIDYGITGEAEISLPLLLKSLKRGEELNSIKGIAFRSNGRVVVTEPAPVLKDVDSAPFPARHLVKNELYFSFITKYRNFSPLITSRGCPFRCIFCEQGGKLWRPRSPKNVVDEVEESYRRFGIREFDFFDSSFTINPGRVIEICRELKKRRLPIVWAARSRIDCIRPEMLKEMAEAGCMRIYYGIESGNRKILKTLKKDVPLDRIKDVLEKTKKYGIDTFGYFMIGNPGETRKTIMETIAFSLSLPLDYAQYSKVTPMPGTELYEMLKREKGRDFWREIILDRTRDDYLPRPGTSLSEKEIQRWTRLAYLLFYYRPATAMRLLRRVKSFHELRRSVKTALEMLFSGT